ncbi:GNAT family N-acetyltransferase [Metabacillus litoralis]|uniref:GNAT family N-acetyltransferase n=1 Tax=Metabacillus litoralis TaxID=152268 RepID=A0A5C6VX97_9BACI|nr:GNAT family N-acetyltransferase [Metabacillus litoralis]TXC89246.1 GNAT family N-acetyltransferase [Metabacillus litoralis]
MRVEQKIFKVKHLEYIIRSANGDDAKQLSQLRLQIDGETENLDREQGEAYIDELEFVNIIKNDTESISSLFLIAEVNGVIVGFSRCAGNKLKRTAHKVEFGVCVLKAYWGFSIGKNLLIESIHWADSSDIKKINLSVLETNAKALKLYEKYGFEVEGVLKKDKLLSDGQYYDTILMGKFCG